MAKSPEEMAAAMIANMKEKTGKTLDAWVKIAARSGLEKHGQTIKHLKSEHGMTHGFANLVAHTALKSDASWQESDDLVSARYAGPKEPLRPIYDALIKAVGRFGKDVEISPKKAYVSLRRNKQFGLIQPSTKPRVDVGINLKGVQPTKRLEASGSFNSMVSHRVRVSDVSEVDKELIRLDPTGLRSLVSDAGARHRRGCF
jgi:predicted transport protein